MPRETGAFLIMIERRFIQKTFANLMGAVALSLITHFGLPTSAYAAEDFVLDSQAFTYHFPSPDNIESKILEMKSIGRINKSASELAMALQNRVSLPPSYVITIDDGYSAQANILGILNKYSVKATFFYIPWDGDRVHTYLTPSQIKEISDAGHEIGSHTKNHPKDLPEMMFRNWGDYLQQVVESKRIIESITGKPVRTFAYPYGRYSQALADDLANYYSGAFTTEPGSTHRLSRAMLLPRISVN